MREYVNNDGASYEPVLLDLATAGSEDYQIQAYKGFIADNNHEQYAHKFYSVRLAADQDVTIPIQLSWFEQIAVITDIGGVETTVHTTGTDDNTVEFLTVDLTRGVNDLHILTYTGVADQRLEITLDLASIHSSITPLGTAGASFGPATAQVHIDSPDALDTAVCKMIYVHADYAPNGLTLTTCRIETDASSTYSVDFEIWDDPLEGSPTAVATVATSASTEAETSSLSETSVDAGQYVMASLPVTEVSWLGIEIFFTRN
jgi:hypothetical protein